MCNLYRHILFIFQLKNYDKPVVISRMVDSDRLEDVLGVQAIYERLQSACKNRVDFTLGNMLIEYEDIKDDKYVFVNDLEEMAGIIEKEIELGGHEPLPPNAIARDANHLTLGIYPDRHVTFNVVANEDVIVNYVYNITFRPGRLVYTDGHCTHHGCIRHEFLSKYDETAAKWLEENKGINMKYITAPYG